MNHLRNLADDSVQHYTVKLSNIIIQEMLDIGAIRESKSPFSLNVVIIRKKDGTIHFCINFRKLNARTKKDAYAIPRVKDTLHMLAGAKYFSKLVLKSGYWQVELDEADKAKTAFQVRSVGCLGESFALWAL